ncbi:MAG TPA: hypothetical protein VEZ16_11875 [Microvirga sp.]|nr:hypothetical protein [Microvirga sp.]
MRLLHRSGVCALALMAGAAALQFEPAVVRNLAFEDGGARLTVDAVKVPLWSAARAQAPDTFGLENVRFTFGSATYEARRIDLSGVTSPRADVEALFSASSSAPLAERLTRVNARQITIPELKVSQKIGPETQETVHKNVVLSDIVQGRIGQATADTTGAKLSDGKTSLSISYGRMSVGDVDLPAFTRLYETKADGSSAPLTRIHGAFSIEDIGAVDDEGVSLKVARLSGRDFMARPTKETWAGTTELLTSLGGKDERSPDEEAQLVSVIADFLSAFDIGLVEATGFEVRDTSTDNPSTGRIARLAYSRSADGKPADARAEGFEVTDKDGFVRIGTLGLTGFSLKPTLEALKSIDREALKNLDPTAMRTLVPTLGTLRVANVEVDSLSDEGPGSPPERVKASLKEFELTADKPFNAIPTNIRLGFRNFAIDLPPDSQEDGIKDLLALGYRNIDLSFLLAANWNEAAGELALSEVSVDGRDMGSVTLTGILGNVSKEVFDPDTAVASVALIGAKAKSLEVTVRNTGLFERFLETTAKEEKTTPEALRRTYGTAAAVAIPAMLGNSEQAKTLSQAVARFIAKPGRLTINAQAKDPAGLGVVDLLSLSEPADALTKLNITARVE